MKKIYFAPNTTVVKVELSKMIATSNPEGFAEDLEESEGGDGSVALSRGSFIWDDEEY